MTSTPPSAPPLLFQSPGLPSSSGVVIELSSVVIFDGGDKNQNDNHHSSRAPSSSSSSSSHSAQHRPQAPHPSKPSVASKRCSTTRGGGGGGGSTPSSSSLFSFFDATIVVLLYCSLWSFLVGFSAAVVKAALDTSTTATSLWTTTYVFVLFVLGVAVMVDTGQIEKRRGDDETKKGKLFFQLQQQLQEAKS